MYNPSAIGDPNCYSSSIPNTEVHAAAGPGNHWYYLLSQGSNPSGGPASPTCNGSSVTGIGIQKAQQIMYNAMLLEDVLVVLPEVPDLDADRGQEPVPGQLHRVQHRQGGVGRGVGPGAGRRPDLLGHWRCDRHQPGRQIGTVGTAISSFTLSATGGTAPYTWTGFGLPPGVSVSSSGTVSGTPTTAGTYNATVTATAASGGSGSATFTFTISGGGGGCSGQKLGNPGFETGTAAPWSASAGVIDSSASQAAHAGAWKAWLDGYGTTHTDTLSQSVAIPAGCGATLTFYLHVDTAETTTSVQYDKLTVKAGSTTLATYSNLNKASGYSQKSFNVSSFAGQTVTIASPARRTLAADVVRHRRHGADGELT